MGELRVASDLLQHLDASEYIENQLKEDELGDQLRIPGTGPFTGGK